MTDTNTEAIKARAEAAEAKLAEVERERDKRLAERKEWTRIAAENAQAADAALAQVETLRKALESVMVGGNHVALLIGADHPPAGTSYDDALRHYGAGDQYEAWCCWNTIMQARAALAATPAQEGETIRLDIPLPPYENPWPAREAADFRWLPIILDGPCGVSDFYATFPSGTRQIISAMDIEEARPMRTATPAQEGETGWQPIDSAPKGEKLLLCFEAYGFLRRTVATYYKTGTLESEHEDSGYAPAGWYEEVWSLEELPYLHGEPKFWMRLPAVPALPAPPVQTTETK